jgi:cold shock CspA family protein
MANNIKIVGSILNTEQVSRYDSEDTNLLSSNIIQESFGQQNDYIEYFIYDAGGNLLNADYSYKSFKLPSTYGLNPAPYKDEVGVVSNYSQSISTLPIIEIDPILDLRNIGYSSGEFKVQYNFFNNRIEDLFLKEISADRTEIRVGSTILTNEQIESGSLALINEYSSSAYFVDYLINFGDNTQAVAVNVALNKVESGYEILFKLYQPLSDDIQEKTSLWVVREKVNPYSFNINLDKLILPPPIPVLRGPNFGIKIDNQNNVATSYQTYTSLVNSIQSISTSSYQQLLSLITSQSIDINTDYTNFLNFTFFSSAKERVIKFYNKVKSIEDYNTNISIYVPLTASRADLINDYNIATASINNIISKFDGFEYYLYFSSGSITSPDEYGITPYPKSTTTLPYKLYPTASTSASEWLSASTASAISYDDNNQNYIVNTLPSFIKDDEDNDPYITFINMVGHYFDNIWVFLQAVTDVNLANNNLEQGVSKDLVYNVLESLGIKLYNQYGDSNNIDFLVGASGSANWDNNFTSTGSYLNTIPRKDLLAESYKRIYHNLPLLLKTKGTAYGLQTLVSTFGITGSTLTIKEYGGDTKAGLLDEFNNDKIRIASNTVTGSVLSPYISLQENPTSSTSFRTNDLHYVDVSFSPQEKIDIFTSASIAATANSTWSLDDFIGDPRYQYDNSYPTLDTERNTYYSALTASVVPYTGSVGSGSIAATDYNSFIRLIQFFDNSLFKMLKDYVPARANLSTGITISSPVLERNKWSYANTSDTSEIDVNEGNIDMVNISTEYNNLYKKLSGNKAAYYNGSITGSQVNVYNYFENSNPNPYLFDTASWNAQHTVSESANLNKFLHSDFNVLFNNISSSIVSTNRQDIQYIFGTTQSILSPAELQDSYETLRTHQLSRYEGSKLSSLVYNTYTSASSTYGGDTSFGKTAVIDRYSRKLGLFTDIVSSSYLPGRNNVRLLYLVDEFGGLTELNLRNKHWQEIQNTFVQSETLDVSQFDNQKFGNQKTTDGTKDIFDSGYSYSPILYFTTCSNNPTLYFQYNGSSNSYQSLANTSGTGSKTINGYPTNNYPLSSGTVNNIFDIVTLGSEYLKAGTLSQYPTYSVQEGGNHKVSGSLSMTFSMPEGGTSTWTLDVYKNGVSTGVTDTQTFAVLNAATASNTETALYSYSSTLYPTTVVSNKPIQINAFLTKPAGTTFTKWNAYFLTSSTYPPYPTCNFGGGSGEWYSLYDYSGGVNTTSIGCLAGINTRFEFDWDMYRIDDFDTPAGNQSATFAINSSTVNADKNDILSIRFKNTISSSDNFTASFTDSGNLFIGSLALSTGYSSTNCPYFNSASMAVSASITGSDDTIVFTGGVSSFYGSNYNFVPNPLTGSVSPLYGEYGDVDYPFLIKPYDVLIVYLSDGTYVESRILGVTGGGNSPLNVKLDTPLSTLLRSDLTVGSGAYQSFLILSKIPDETSAYLTFKKRGGKTSYGFIIPNDIAPDILTNIDTITREVKQKLINEQSVINDINGGTFG